MKISSGLLKKFRLDPETCSSDELDLIEKYFLHYKMIRDIYRAAIDNDPTCEQLSSHLLTLKYYKNKNSS